MTTISRYIFQAGKQALRETVAQFDDFQLRCCLLYNVLEMTLQSPTRTESDRLVYAACAAEFKRRNGRSPYAELVIEVMGMHQ